MPITYAIDPARRLIRTTLRGRVTDGEMEAHVARLLADPAFDPAFDSLVDARGVTELAVTTGAVRGSARRSVLDGEARQAIVVSGDETYGMSRMLQSMATRGDDRMLVVRDMDEALRWLGIE